MTPGHLTALWRAEMLKLLSRTSGRVGLAIAACIGLLGPLLLYGAANSAAEVNGAPFSEWADLDLTPTGSLATALEVRNFFVMRALLLLLGALSMAGEYAARTLREDVLRPVPRWSILFAKWTALGGWLVLCTGLTFLTASILGVILFGTEGSWVDLGLGYAATVATDLAFAALVLAVAVVSRSVSGTIVGVFLFLILDKFTGWGMTLLSWVGELAELPWILEATVQARPWLPSSALGLWVGYRQDVDWTWQSFAALAASTAICALVAERFFARTDIP